MPTGYTAQLMEKGFDLKNWLKEVVPRAMDICVTLREEPLDLTQDKIEEVIKKEQDSYCAREINKELKECLEWNASKWKRACEAKYKKEMDYYKKHMEKFNKEKKEFEKAKTTVLELLRRSEDEVTTSTLTFALEQIESTLGFDYKHIMDAPVKEDPEEYKIRTLEKLLRDMEYYEVEAKKDRQRVLERFTAYKQYTKFVDENL